MLSFVARQAPHFARRAIVTCASMAPRPEAEEGVTPPPLTQLSEEEIALKETVKRFSNDVIKPLVREMDHSGHVSERTSIVSVRKSFQMHESVIKGCFENGLMGVEVPAEYDGPEAGFFSVNLIVEELARVDPAVSTAVDVHNTLVVPLIIELGTKEQKEKYLPKLHTEWVGSFCLSEPSSGSDAFALKTTAKAEGDDYILNGGKMWI